MINFKKNNINEKGTLLIEAIAMLGLIALVTPTLYKKSAERLQEIQDINAAGQARTFNHVIETFIKSEYAGLVTKTLEAGDSRTIELSLNDSSGAGFYDKGYSSFVPYGYVPGDIKNYGSARVFVRNDDGKLMSYILFPAIIDPGKKRAARLASLVGANGGIVTKPLAGGGNDLQADGTGGAWALDKDMLQGLIDGGASSASAALVENSLMVTSTEPISITNEDSDKFLYRIPPEAAGNDQDKVYRNTMIANLYMGGHTEESDNAGLAQQYYSIYNVRRLSLNTNCNYEFMNDSSRAAHSLNCEPEVADLYIGKPFGLGSSGTLGGNIYERGYQGSGNTGAAWIYGNLSALKDNFRLFRTGSAGHRGIDGYNDDMERIADGYDVLEFARVGSSSSDVGFSVFRAENSESSARVSMLEDFVVAGIGTGNVPEFMVGKDDTETDAKGTLMYAKGDDDERAVRINSVDGTAYAGNVKTEINRQGGTVYINGSSNTGRVSETYINEGGGRLQAGERADWILAEGKEGSAKVHLLQNAGNENNVFTVGNTDVDANHMIYANSSTVSLRGGLLRAYGHYFDVDTFPDGGSYLISGYNTLGPELPARLGGQLALTSRYTDVLGSAYFGMDKMGDNVDGLDYSRGKWQVGVAGSAWVDDLLFARDAWFHRSGFKELHAGFSSYAAYSSHPQRGWLNAYSSGVMIRNPNVAGSDTSLWSSSDTMFRADNSLVSIYDTEGAGAVFQEKVAKVGHTTDDLKTFDNLFMADSSAANVIGKELVNVYTGSSVSNTSTADGKVNIQNNAMLFTGQAGDLDVATRQNTIEARAKQFAIKTAKKGENENIEQSSQFYLDGTDAKVRYVDFGVYDASTSATVFKVMPDEKFNASGADKANVQVRGSFHVTGNEVIHVASNASNRAGSSDADAHAMFEVDPEYVQIWAKDGSGYAKNGDYFAMLKVNPKDIGGGPVSSAVLNDASIYVRRGAIELEESSGSSYAADEGYGYIKANRFVSNVAGVDIPSRPGTSYGTEYDQFMVNPAYTSVMHDIKLTTRGGARLSDILPDYVLKGVYNLVNNKKESNRAEEVDDMTTWASPYIGKIPYAPCPPGYRNLATVMPISFRMGEAGDIMLASSRFATGLETNGTRYVINPNSRHIQVLDHAAASTGGKVIQDMTLEGISTLVYNEVYKSASSFADFQNQMQMKTEGWFLGLKAVHDGSSWSDADLISEIKSSSSTGVPVWEYAADGRNFMTVPTPIYFQQNTWLKTSVVPADKGWEAYMGFLYDKRSALGGTDAAGTVLSNYNQKGYNDEGAGGKDLSAGLVWNMFPVPTYSLEGHGTVYCYFDRQAFLKDGNWTSYIENIDQLGALKGGTDNSSGATFIEPGGNKPNDDYLKRLHDPSLKYSDPW